MVITEFNVTPSLGYLHPSPHQKTDFICPKSRVKSILTVYIQRTYSVYKGGQTRGKQNDTTRSGF